MQRRMPWPGPAEAVDATPDAFHNNDKGASHQEPACPSVDGSAQMVPGAVPTDRPWSKEVQHDDPRSRHEL